MGDWDGRGVVSADWLAAHLADPDVRVFDATVHLRPSNPGPYAIESGRADYENAHVPGAAFLDLVRDFSDPSARLAFTMPSIEAFAKALGDAGVGERSRVVIYSATTPMWATRMWWMLHASGFENAAVLDGGLAKWRREGRPTESGVAVYAHDRVALKARPQAWADKAEVLSALDDGGVCTINALPASVHAGTGPTNYGRKGHIKNSRNVPFAALLDEEGAYRPDADLRALFTAIGAFERGRAICYCGGGISATMDALALVRLGHPSVAVYDGSMSEWARDPKLPMEEG